MALPPHRLRGPATPSPVHAHPWHLLAAPAPVGLSIKWSSRSPTTGHRKQGVVYHPLWTPTPAVIITVRSPVWFRPAHASCHWMAVRGLSPPILLSPHVHPPLAHHPPAQHLPLMSAHPLPPWRNRQSSPGGGESQAP